MRYMEEIDEEPVGMPFVAYYNLDMEELDVEMGFPVSKHVEGKGHIKASEIPASKKVAYLHKGPYEESAEAYAAMAKWIEEQGYIPTGVAYEYYYNAPDEVSESELLTKIVLPLK